MASPEFALRGPVGGVGGLGDKLGRLSWLLLLLLTAAASVGFMLLFSAANGNIDPWASRQMVRFGAGVVVLIIVAMVDIRFWMSLAYPAYFGALVMLVAVEFIGVTGMGAQRWLDLGPFVVQPSEFMKIAMVLALARYLHGLEPQQVSHPLRLLPSIFIIFAPVALVLKQPDLGTALLLLAGGCMLLFLAGLSWRIVIAGVLAGLSAMAVGWRFLEPYQQQRVLTFLDPESDPMGSGYHIMQSKIAFGSGGVFGKGFLQGTQSHLNFLPEKQTDFILPILAEEMGFVGAIGLLGLYLMILGYGLSIAIRSRHHFGRLVTLGVLITFLLYILINTSMVMGL
ncbi:MAG: rod shape-determining protein RodA, partial [Pseudomonadota bacterium]